MNDRSPPTPLPLRVAAVAAVFLFFTLVLRFWHPAYHFTAFLQLDTEQAKIAIPAWRELPIFVHEGVGAYDGHQYALVAYDPTLRSPEVRAALDNPSFRGTRILGPALAWILAAGKPEWIAHVYASLNLGVWGVMAALAWRLLAVSDWRSWFAWAGLLFSAGVLHSVRLALTDLLAATAIAAGLLAVERSRHRLALGLLALAGLARETATAAATALWQGPWTSPQRWARNLAVTAVVAAPLVAWLIYVRTSVAGLNVGLGNFGAPLAGLALKLRSTAETLRTTTDPMLAWSTALAVAGVLAQIALLCLRPRPQDAWWRMAVPFVLLAIVLGDAAWEGLPGAFARVLLPIHLAFSVIAVRQKVSWPWLIAGNLGLLSGVIAFREIPYDGHEVARGKAGNVIVMARASDGWYLGERSWTTRRRWSRQTSTLLLETWPRSESCTVALSGEIRGHAPTALTISQEGRTLWSGAVGTLRQSVAIGPIAVVNGQARLELRADAPETRLGQNADARSVSFAVYDLVVKPSGPHP